MLALGYDEYGASYEVVVPFSSSQLGHPVTQGGDWGYFVCEPIHSIRIRILTIFFKITQITRKIATVYGHKHSKAWHSNFPLWVVYPITSKAPRP